MSNTWHTEIKLGRLRTNTIVELCDSTVLILQYSIEQYPQEPTMADSNKKKHENVELILYYPYQEIGDIFRLSNSIFYLDFSVITSHTDFLQPPWHESNEECSFKLGRMAASDWRLKEKDVSNDFTCDEVMPIDLVIFHRFIVRIT